MSTESQVCQTGGGAHKKNAARATTSRQSQMSRALGSRREPCTPVCPECTPARYAPSFSCTRPALAPRTHAPGAVPRQNAASAHAPRRRWRLATDGRPGDARRMVAELRRAASAASRNEKQPLKRQPVPGDCRDAIPLGHSARESMKPLATNTNRIWGNRSRPWSLA